MNYNGKTVAVTGATGFLGSAITSYLEQEGANVYKILGDVRDPETFAFLNHRFDYLFHFADPSSQVLFKQQPMYAAETTILSFINAAKVCQEHGIKLIYPSTGLLSSERANEYARCKKVCEDIHLGSNLDAIGMRIFATYGPGEGHKRDFASVPYLFARDMAAGRSPVVFGDGKQVRDLIYISDVAWAVLTLAEQCNDKIVDIGSGTSVSFLEIIRQINDALGTDIQPTFVEKPGGYVQETSADPSRMMEYYTPRVDLKTGIEFIVKSLTERKKSND